MILLKRCGSNGSNKSTLRVPVTRLRRGAGLPGLLGLGFGLGFELWLALVFAGPTPACLRESLGFADAVRAIGFCASRVLGRFLGFSVVVCAPRRVRALPAEGARVVVFFMMQE